MRYFTQNILLDINLLNSIQFLFVLFIDAGQNSITLFEKISLSFLVLSRFITSRYKDYVGLYCQSFGLSVYRSGDFIASKANKYTPIVSE